MQELILSKNVKFVIETEKNPISVNCMMNRLTKLAYYKENIDALNALFFTSNKNQFRYNISCKNCYIKKMFS